MPNFPAKSAPGAERIRAAFKDAQSMAQTAVAKALYCGQLLIEQRDSLSGSHLVKDRTTPSDQKFDVWLAKSVPEISRPTAYRWMQLAETVLSTVGHLQDGMVPCDMGMLMSPSDVLGEPTPHKLPENAQDYRQLVFDFIEGKTMRECLAGVVVEGDEAHRIVRAHNGRTKGGAGGNRKAFARFTATKLKHITTFVNSNLPQAEVGKIAAAFEIALESWPQWLIKVIAEKAHAESRISEVERAARGKS